MATLDRAASGQRWFGLVLSNAGGVAANLPPNQQIVAGTYGPQPLVGMSWALYCGRLDPAPNLNGCPASQTAAPYYYRHYPGAGNYVGVSATDQHLYFLSAQGVMSNLGLAADWAQRAGCR